MSQEQIIVTLVVGFAFLIVYGLGLLTGWAMGKRLLKSTMAAVPSLNYNDSGHKADKKKHSTHDTGKNPFNDAHISAPVPTRFETLNEEKK